MNVFSQIPCANCAQFRFVGRAERYLREKGQILDIDDDMFFLYARVHGQVLNVHMTPNLLHLNTSSAVSPPLFPFGDFGAGSGGKDPKSHRKSVEH